MTNLPSKTRGKTEQIRSFILQNVEDHPNEIATLVSSKFGITRQAVNKHLQALIKLEKLSASGATRNRSYSLKLKELYFEEFTNISNLKEHVVWQDNISSLIIDLDEKHFDIIHYGFTEILNNAIDHSESQKIKVQILQSAISTQIYISDFGIGIFKKIKNELNLDYEREAILELSKGKLTTDPSKHTGEGIFFTSRAFTKFFILSRGLFFSHNKKHKQDHLMDDDELMNGTFVLMELKHESTTSLEDIFNEFAQNEEYQFDKTIVPIILAQHENQNLVSRSQAKRVLHRLKKFNSVILDFEGVNKIGQAFADEIFRVFAEEHKEITIKVTNSNPEVKKMINRAKLSL